jgi:hypothetical protein
MGFGVFIHRSDSIYDDSPAEQYQFPSQYLRRVEACVGDWIIYYEPRKIAETRGYFAIAKVSQIISDPGVSGMYLALIEPGSYLDFANPVGTAHWMFDRGLISLADDLEILVSRQTNDPQGIRSIINKSGRAPAPRRISDRPHPHFLKWHREHCFKQ